MLFQNSFEVHKVPRRDSDGFPRFADRLGPDERDSNDPASKIAFEVGYLSRCPICRFSIFADGKIA